MTSKIAFPLTSGPMAHCGHRPYALTDQRLYLSDPSNEAIADCEEVGHD